MKIVNKVSTLTSIGLTVLLVIFIVTSLGTYVDKNALDSGVTLPPEYTNMTNIIQVEQDALKANIDNMTSAFSKVTEPENTAFAVWNGMRGIGFMLKMPLTMVESAVNVLGSFSLVTFGIPVWVTILALIALTLLILFTVIGALKGESRM